MHEIILPKCIVLLQCAEGLNGMTSLINEVIN